MDISAATKKSIQLLDNFFLVALSSDSQFDSSLGKFNPPHVLLQVSHLPLEKEGNLNEVLSMQFGHKSIFKM